MRLSVGHRCPFLSVLCSRTSLPFSRAHNFLHVIGIQAHITHFCQDGTIIGAGMRGQSEGKAGLDDRVLCCTLGLVAALVTYDTTESKVAKPSAPAQHHHDETTRSQLAKPVRNKPKPKARLSDCDVTRAAYFTARIFFSFSLLSSNDADYYHPKHLQPHHALWTCLSSSSDWLRLHGREVSVVCWPLTSKDCLCNCTGWKKPF